MEIAYIRNKKINVFLLILLTDAGIKNDFNDFF
jgi:hypothetical protein